MCDNFVLITHVVLLLPSRQITIKIYKFRPMCTERKFLKYSFVTSKRNEDADGEYSASKGDDKAFKIIIMELKV